MIRYFHWRTLRTSLLAILALGLALPAHAYSVQCNREIRLHCADVVLGEGRLTACAIKHRERMSANCKSEVQAAMESRGAFLAACKENTESFCPKLKSGLGRVYACLKFNEEQISPACKAQLK